MELHDLAKLAERQGFKLRTGGSHTKWFSSAGALVGVSPNPFDKKVRRNNRGHLNLEAQLRRAGLRMDRNKR